MKNLIMVVCSATVLVLSGCATILGHNTQTVGFNSTPPGAHIAITDEQNATVFEGKTPTTVTLRKSTGHYWGGKNYLVKVTLPGYQEQDIALKTSPNGWYIGGNILFGGLIGWFIVDPLNGGMYTLSPDQVNATLAAQTAANFKYKNGDLAIVMLKDVPQNLRAQMVRVGTLHAE